MMTYEQAVEYLSSMGVSLPEFLVRAFLDQVNSISECLSEHYSPATALVIQSYLLALLALSSANSVVTSETAPTGASRSYADPGGQYSAIYASLRSLDTHGCATGLIPPDTFTTKHGGIWIGRGGRFNCR